MKPSNGLGKRFLMTALIGLSIELVAATPRTNAALFSKKAGEAYRKLPEVKKGGVLRLHLLTNPKVLNPLLASDVPSMDLSGLLFARLMQADFETGEYYPMLAEKIEATPDRKHLTFTLRKAAVWEDGTPITTEDVEFSFNTLMDPQVNAAPKRAYFEGYRFEKVDALTFKFQVEKPNVNTVSSILDDFFVIQKKQFAGAGDFNKARGIMEPVTSGPYRLKTFSRDQRVELELKTDWWGFAQPEFRNQYNFKTLVYRIISDPALAYEKFVKGDIDLLEMNAETYGSKVRGIDREKFGSDSETPKNLWARHFETRAPSTWSYVGWNLNRPWFKSLKTRQALARLVNLDEIISKVYFGEAIPAISPFGSRTPNTSPGQKSIAIKYDPKKALVLLKEDGWADLDASGVLSKVIDGKPVRFEFTLRYNSESPMRAKIAQIVKEQFKKVGIVVNVQALEFNSLLEKRDARDFDAVVLAWAKGSLNEDSRQIWHSKSAENKGSNFISYSNPEADRLIEKASAEIDVERHFQINQKIAKVIYEDQPYLFIAEVPGFIMGVSRTRVRASKWAMKYDGIPPIAIYSSAE